jgi:TrmH family RNA methyltransferase
MITSPANPRVRLVRALQSRRKARGKEQQFVIEGVRLAEEALRAGPRADFVFYVDQLDARGRAALDGLRGQGAAVAEVTAEVMAACSDDETPPGLLAVLPIPPPQPFVVLPSAFLLVVDRLADPGNLGAILRTAAAAGVGAVFLSPGTVDAYNPKVVRSAMGAHFRLPIRQAGWPEIQAALAGRRVYLAAAAGGQSYHRVDWTLPAALIVGGEAEGASEAAERLADARVSIPMPGGGESLNAAVAAGILLFEALRGTEGQTPAP